MAAWIVPAKKTAAMDPQIHCGPCAGAKRIPRTGLPGFRQTAAARTPDISDEEKNFSARRERHAEFQKQDRPDIRCRKADQKAGHDGPQNHRQPAPRPDTFHFAHAGSPPEFRQCGPGAWLTVIAVRSARSPHIRRVQLAGESACPTKRKPLYQDRKCRFGTLHRVVERVALHGDAAGSADQL